MQDDWTQALPGMVYVLLGLGGLAADLLAGRQLALVAQGDRDRRERGERPRRGRGERAERSERTQGDSPTLPAFACVTAVAADANTTCTWPAIRSTMAGAPPL